jgi:hypothetical protein
VQIWATFFDEYEEGLTTEVVWDGSGFAPSYSVGSSVDNAGAPTSISFALARAGGWKSDPTLHVSAVDELGNLLEEEALSFEYTAPPPPPPDIAPPSVSNFTPSGGENITKQTPIGFDVTDDTGLAVVFIYAKYAKGETWEVVHDGHSFSPLFAGLSTREAIANGYRFSVRRVGGWPSSPTIVPVPVDQFGNESEA